MLLENPIEILGPAEKQAIQDASTFVTAGMPVSDLVTERLMYLSQALRHREVIADLQSSVKYTQAQTKADLLQVEHETHEDLKDEYSDCYREKPSSRVRRESH